MTSARVREKSGISDPALPKLLVRGSVDRLVLGPATISAAATAIATSAAVSATIITRTVIAPVAAAILRLTAFRRHDAFGFGAFLERGFAAQFHAAFVVDADAFDPNHLADFCDVFSLVDAEICELADENEGIFSRGGV